MHHVAVARSGAGQGSQVGLLRLVLVIRLLKDYRDVGGVKLEAVRWDDPRIVDDLLRSC